MCIYSCLYNYWTQFLKLQTANKSLNERIPISKLWQASRAVVIEQQLLISTDISQGPEYHNILLFYAHLDGEDVLSGLGVVHEAGFIAVVTGVDAFVFC